MSINVTVKGNPVSIKRGKMITADPNTAKKEFDKRRLLRLEQVRQQSKEIAEDVRNKVRREKNKQMGQIEKEGKEKLKNWQNRKLLELQNQYLDAVDEIGIAHKEAEDLADENQLLENERMQQEETVKTRGRLADTKLQVQKNQDSYKKAMPIQHKKLVRDIENTRAALVSAMPPSPAKKTIKKCPIKAKRSKPLADINITIPNDSDFSEASSSSDSSRRLPKIREEEPDEHSEGFCECSEEDDCDALDPIAEGNEQIEPSKPEAKEKSYSESIEERRKLIESFRNRPREVPRDTRISDRIKRRQLMASQPDYCDFIADPTPVSEVTESNRVRNKISSRASSQYVEDPLALSADECICAKFHKSCPCGDVVAGNRRDCKCPQPKEVRSSSKTDNRLPSEEEAFKPSQRSSKTKFEAKTKHVETGADKSSGPPKEIPSRPAVKLKNAGQSTSPRKGRLAAGGNGVNSPSHDPAKVPHYDYPNRFERDLPSTSHIEKIPATNIEVIPDPVSESEWRAKMKQRDLDAQERGRRALEKEKVQRDYEEIMKKLPILQRKEHIAQIGTDKPEFHMSEERLKERERERQNRLENAYSKAIPDLKPQIVTIPSRRHDIPTNDEPFQILDGEDSRTLNLGKWDIDKPKTMFSTEEVQEIIRAFTVQKPEDRKTKLRQLLKSLKLQKEQLINEIRALPKDDSINALIGDLTSFGDDERESLKKHRKSDKKRRLEESGDTTSTTSGEDKKGKRPYKKMKKPPPKVLVLQNTSTQTTPKATKEKTSTSTSSSDKAKTGIKICTKTHVPCDCARDLDGKPSEEVCKIYIKLNEEESPKVEVVRPVGGDDKKETKSEAPKADSSRKSKKADRQPPVKDSRESWKEHLSKNSISTSSTSYLSPPDFSKPSTEAYKMRKKPQFASDQEMLSYVKRLLSMSRTSVDELGVSSSDVQTPSQSVIEMESNNPLAALHNIVRFINFRSADIAKELSVSGEDMPVPPNSSVSGSGGSRLEKEEKTKESVLSQYADVTDSCTKRIAKLAAMIEQLRQEKIQMLEQSTPQCERLCSSKSPRPLSDKDSSTRYLEFPPFGDKSRGTNSTASTEEEELNRRLMEIDMSLAEKLKRFSQAKGEQSEGETQQEQPDDTNQQFLQRLQRLIQDDREQQPEPEPEEAFLLEEDTQVAFVPFLVDIPKLPILGPEPNEGSQQKRPHPPPSKGLISARKFNGDIPLVPHELSTIVEADSQMSTKLSQASLSPSKDKIQPLSPTVEESSPRSGPTEAKSEEVTDSCTEYTCPNFGSSSSSSKHSLSSSSSSGDMKSIEAMLRSIGMDWAIPTLHKTQEALALTSSSSCDLSCKKKTSSKSTSTSEVNLKDFLRKQMISRISSSSLNKSDASPASFLQECSEISAIQCSAEKCKQRTSTPVLSSKSTSKSKEEQQNQLFTGVSDISSVKVNSSKSSEKQTFQSLAGEDESSPTKSSVE